MKQFNFTQLLLSASPCPECGIAACTLEPLTGPGGQRIGDEVACRHCRSRFPVQGAGAPRATAPSCVICQAAVMPCELHCGRPDGAEWSIYVCHDCGHIEQHVRHLEVV